MVQEEAPVDWEVEGRPLQNLFRVCLAGQAGVRRLQSALGT